MKFAPLGTPLKSTQIHLKAASFGEKTKKLRGCKIILHLQWASGLVTAALILLNCQFMVNLHGCFPV